MEIRCKVKYYNGCIFHNVQQNYLVQSGDPTGTGEGGDSVYKQLYGDQARFFEDEIRPHLRHNKVGVVGMASKGKDKNASQFYVTTRDRCEDLDDKFTIFGQVAEGLDSLAKINDAFCDTNGRPYQNIRIRHTILLDDPFDDPPGLQVPEQSPLPVHDPDDVRLSDDEEVAPPDEEDEEKAQKKIEDMAASSRAVVLEMVGDLPDADIKPPDNVLFICKLNPVTKDEDLELIFSRFGTIVTCEIIKDWKSGESLCYGFIEFETKESCEDAYFKMNNVLIDDRRIKVDFSQSVAKLWGSYYREKKRRGGKRGGSGPMPLDSDAAAAPSRIALKGARYDRRGGGGDMLFDHERDLRAAERQERSRPSRWDDPRRTDKHTPPGSRVERRERYDEPRDARERRRSRSRERREGSRQRSPPRKRHRGDRRASRSPTADRHRHHHQHRRHHGYGHADRSRSDREHHR